MASDSKISALPAVPSSQLTDIIPCDQAGVTSQATLSQVRAAIVPIVEADITLADNTTDNVSSTKHGFAPKSPADATQYLNGAATPAFAQVKDSDLSTSDIATNNVSTAKHGFAPKAPNDGTKFLDGTGVYDGVDLTTDVGATVLPVANGGTGSATLNAHGVVLGEGTAAVGVTATGASGDVFRSGGASADPSWFTPFASSAYNSGAESINSATFTALTFDTNTFDRGGVHSTSTNPSRFTVPAGGAGIYMCSSFVLWAGNATGQRQMLIRLNGSTTICTSEVAGSAVFNAGNFVTFPVFLNVGDYIEFVVYQDSGGALNTSSGQTGLGGSVVRQTPT